MNKQKKTATIPIDFPASGEAAPLAADDCRRISFSTVVFVRFSRRTKSMSLSYHKELNQFSEDFRDLLIRWEAMTYAIINSGEINTRESAIVVKKIMTDPLGVYNARHNLVSSSGRIIRRSRKSGNSSRKS